MGPVIAQSLRFITQVMLISFVYDSNGYFLLRRGVNHCGVADAASYPVV